MTKPCIGFIAKQRRRLPFTQICQFADRLGLLPQVLSERRGVGLPVPVRSVLVADRLGATQAANVQIRHPSPTERRCERRLRKAALAGQRKITNVNDNTDVCVPQLPEKDLQLKTLISDCKDFHRREVCMIEAADQRRRAFAPFQSRLIRFRSKPLGSNTPPIHRTMSSCCSCFRSPRISRNIS